jgi:hypothetical protein
MVDESPSAVAKQSIEHLDLIERFVKNSSIDACTIEECNSHCISQMDIIITEKTIEDENDRIFSIGAIS